MELRMDFRKSIIKDINRLKINLKNWSKGVIPLGGNLKKSPLVEPLKKGFRLPPKGITVKESCLFVQYI